MDSQKKRYRLYVDESGDHTFKNLDDPAKRYLGLTGVMLDTEYYRTDFQPDLKALKQKHFPHNPDEPVVLHRRDMVDRKGPFWRLRDDAKRIAFDQDFLSFLNTHKYIVITVVIDKKRHVETYGVAAYHPYHYCLTALLERYCGLLNYGNAIGDVLAESRGGGEDEPLKEAYRFVYENGTRFREADFFQRALTSGEIKIKKKEENIAGIQVADLLAYPSRQDVLIRRRLIPPMNDFGEQVRQVITPKYNCRYDTGEIMGYGLVFI